jgi:hypothetical protein
MLPDVEIFGLRAPGVGLVAVAALGMFFGWRGLIGGMIFGEDLAGRTQQQASQTWHAPSAASEQLPAVPSVACM